MPSPILLSTAALSVTNVEPAVLHMIIELEPPPPFRVGVDVIEGHLVIVAIPKYDIEKMLEEDDSLDEDELVVTAPMGCYAFAGLDDDADGTQFRVGTFSGKRLYMSITKL